MKTTCPKCKNHARSPHYIKCYNNEIINGISKKQIKFEFIQYNYLNTFNFINNKENFENHYKTHSLPDYKKLNVPWDLVFFLLEWFNIKKRTFSESALTIGQKKNKETCLKKYGTVNVLSRGTKIFEKRNKTVKDKYGVDNVFQIKEIIEQINTKEAHEKTAIGWKKWFYALSDKEKEDFFNKNIHSDKSKEKIANGQHKGYKISKPEIKLVEILSELNFTYIHQFKIKKPKETQNRYNNKIYYYDIYLPDFNLIIEMNGNYWHANPNFYKADDIVFFKFAHIKAEDIWKRDKLKHDYAKEKGHNIITIWENEIHKKTNDEIKELLIIKINQYANSKNKINQKNTISI